MSDPDPPAPVRPAIPRTPVAAEDLDGQEFVETHCGVAIFCLADGRYHVISNFAVPTLDEARMAAKDLAAAAGSA